MADTEPIYGEPLVVWEAWEYTKHERSVLWYIIAGIIGAALLTYAILTASFPFAVVILMIGIVTLLTHLRDPERIDVAITTTGIAIGRSFYTYREIKNFSVVYNPPQSKILYLDFVSAFHPLTSLPLEDQDPNEVRQALLPYVVENLDRDEETITDLLAKVLKM